MDVPMKTKTEQMYATMNPWKLFFVVAIPGMVSMFAMSVYSVLEGIFIGYALVEEAFAAITIGFPLVLINNSLADLIGVGASVPISITLGKEDYKSANNAFTFLFRWIALTTQSYLSAIEKPARATVMALAIAFVFPVVLLGAL